MKRSLTLEIISPQIIAKLGIEWTDDDIKRMRDRFDELGELEKYIAIMMAHGRTCNQICSRLGIDARECQNARAKVRRVFNCTPGELPKCVFSAFGIIRTHALYEGPAVNSAETCVVANSHHHGHNLERWLEFFDRAEYRLLERNEAALARRRNIRERQTPKATPPRPIVHLRARANDNGTTAACVEKLIEALDAAIFPVPASAGRKLEGSRKSRIEKWRNAIACCMADPDVIFMALIRSDTGIRINEYPRVKAAIRSWWRR